eukprot:18375_1
MSNNDDSFSSNETSDKDWKAEEIDPYNIKPKLLNTTSKQSEEWICHQCHFANNLLSAIQNDYKCHSCGKLLNIMPQKSNTDTNNNMNIQKQYNKQNNENENDQKNYHLNDEEEEKYAINVETNASVIDIDLEIAKTLQNEEMHPDYYSISNIERINNVDENANIDQHSYQMHSEKQYKPLPLTTDDAEILYDDDELNYYHGYPKIDDDEEQKREHEEQKYPQQIELQINPSKKTEPPSESRLLVNTINSSEDRVFEKPCEFAYVQYVLNQTNHEIVVTHQKRPRIYHNINNRCFYHCKFRNKYIMDHRKQRYNMIFIPIYIIFGILCLFIFLAINQMINTKNVSYMNPYVIPKQNVTESELQSIIGCNIHFEDIFGWFDASSFNFTSGKWKDYSIHSNDINMSYIIGEIKLGLSGEHNPNLYVYGSKTDSIKMIPSSLHLSKFNYTMITIARYNGNNKDTIFVSDDSKWVFGFENNKTNIMYHDGMLLTSPATSTMKLFKDEWIINVDSTHVFRSQQQTLYENTNNTNYNDNQNGNNSIKWGINTLNSSDWAITAFLLFNHSLSLRQMQCMETILIDKYNLSLNNHSSVSVPDIKNQPIHECNRWQKGSHHSDIIAWYDINNGYGNNTLFDLSKNKNDILVADSIKIGVEKFDKRFRYLYGSVNDIIAIPIPIDIDSAFWTTIHYVARYNGNDKGSILSDVSSGFYCGFYEQHSGVCYWNNKSLSEFQQDMYDDQWVLSSFYYMRNSDDIIYCAQNCETALKTRIDRNENILQLIVNSKHDTDWALIEIIVIQVKQSSWQFNSLMDTMCIEEYLSNKYNINSYRYNMQNIPALQCFNWFCIILIIIGGLSVNCWLRYGFAGKIFTDSVAHSFQGCNFFFYFGCARCCNCINCCCGLLAGNVGRHCCGYQISILPVYSVVSVISSFTSIIHRMVNARNEICLYLLLNGFTTCVAAVIQFVFIYRYLIGTPDALYNNQWFYFIQISLCMFLWSIMIVD